MTVNTKQVTGRRKLRYESLDDLLADAERCARGDTKQLGNWAPGQTFTHLATSLDSSIDGFMRHPPRANELVNEKAESI